MTDNIYPDKLSLCIGSYSGRSTSLKWNLRNKKIVYGESEYGPCLEVNALHGFIPDELDWKRFWSDIRNIGVWYWREHYDNNTVCDGIFWELELAYGDKKLKSHGTNAYPPQGSDIPSEAFKQLLRAFGELMNDQDFIKTWYSNSWY